MKNKSQSNSTISIKSVKTKISLTLITQSKKLDFEKVVRQIHIQFQSDIFLSNNELNTSSWPETTSLQSRCTSHQS